MQIINIANVVVARSLTVQPWRAVKFAKDAKQKSSARKTIGGAVTPAEGRHYGNIPND